MVKVVVWLDDSESLLGANIAFCFKTSKESLRDNIYLNYRHVHTYVHTLMYIKMSLRYI